MIKRESGKLLSSYTTFKIGGPVSSWLEPEDFDDLLEAVSIAERGNRPLAIIGRGSNILAYDRGFDGVIINLGAGFNYIEDKQDAVLKVGASVSIPRLLKECADSCLAGCEFLTGIPGSFGGAVFMNAGVRDPQDADTLREIKDIIIDVDVLDMNDKKRKTLNRKDINFSYRSSGLDGKCILGAAIELKKDRKAAIKAKIDSFMKKREWMKQLGFPTAGSVFKNPGPGNPAGRLIEECGLKGKRAGGAEISSVHANFIVNRGGATANDVLGLIGLASSSVMDKFGIDLELELKVI